LGAGRLFFAIFTALARFFQFRQKFFGGAQKLRVKLLALRAGKVYLYTRRIGSPLLQPAGVNPKASFSGCVESYVSPPEVRDRPIPKYQTGA
jgi:hypothetical protein